MANKKLNIVKNLHDHDFGRKYLYTLEIERFKNTLITLTALNRYIKKTKSTIEMEFLLTKNLWEDFKNIKSGRGLVITALNAKNEPIAVERFEVYNPKLILGDLNSSFLDDFSLTFKVIFENSTQLKTL